MIIYILFFIFKGVCVFENFVFKMIVEFILFFVESGIILSFGRFLVYK